MLEKDTSVLEDNLRLLRRRMDQSTSQMEFRRKLIGGISEEDVEKFINNLNEQAQKEEEVYKEKIKELMYDKKTLSNELEYHKIELEKAKETAGSLQDQNGKMQEEIAALNEDLDKTKSELADYLGNCAQNHQEESELAEKYKSEIKLLEDEVYKLGQEREAMMKRISELEEEINLARCQLQEGEGTGDRLGERNPTGGENESALKKLEEKVGELEKQLEESHTMLEEQHKTSINLMEQLEESRKKTDENEQLKEELAQKFKREQMKTKMLAKEKAELEARIAQLRNEIFNQIEVLAEQIKVKGKVEDELSFERMRANKAENDMVELVEMVLKLRGKFHNEQKQLDAQLSAIKNKHCKSSYEEIECQFIEDIMQQTSQAIESIMLSAKYNANSIISNATQKVQEISTSYKVLQSDVTGFQSNLESFREKTNEWIEALYSTVEKSCSMDKGDKSDQYLLAEVSGVDEI